MPVDWYNGGMEHVTRHMIYSRFWYKFLYDLKLVPYEEPYAKRTAQGLILGPDGVKMSKSRGNVIDPNDIVNTYGADTLRTYVLFMGEYGSAAPWSENSVKGCRRFIERVASLTDITAGNGVTAELESDFHKTIKKVSEDIEAMKFNTAIAAMMTLLNRIYEVGKLTRDELYTFVSILSPFAPHVCEEINEWLGNAEMIATSAWPTYDEAKTLDATIEIAVQICGKLRATVVIPADASKDDMLAAAKANERIAELIDGKTLIKEICVPGKLVNIVVR